MTELKKRLAENAARIAEILPQYLATTDGDLSLLYESMRYSALAEGKRIRPFLVMEFCRMFGGRDEAALPFACAIECVHASSLIHDDMPCMDNDDLRRGKPTNHVVFGEDIALLAGDALITRGYEIAARNTEVSPEIALAATAMLLKNAGAYGMMGGQQIDLWGEKNKVDFPLLLKMHTKKTGALIRTSALLGGFAAGITTEDDPRMQDAALYAENIGLAFQVIDDILDATSDNITLGKPVHSDIKQEKTTFLSEMSIEDAFAYASEKTDAAIKAIEKYENNEILTELAKYLLNRKK
ncbi:MAG: polyprenyl synthetase family protein [Clostridia bacterium]|nr:polyprenyl synthetase family protein [Clostridia bacterium]